MLEVRNIQTYYGNIQALKNVSLSINEGEIVTLIGANGAGKSTTLNSIMGLVKAGPRASIALVRGGRARALLRGGDFVVPDDVKACALAVLRSLTLVSVLQQVACLAQIAHEHAVGGVLHKARRDHSMSKGAPLRAKTDGTRAIKIAGRQLGAVRQSHHALHIRIDGKKNAGRFNALCGSQLFFGHTLSPSARQAATYSA